MTPRKTTHRRAHRLILGLTAVVAGLVIAACGSSTTTTSTSTTTTAAASATATTTRTAFRKCLQQHGITIPTQPAGTGTSTTHSGPPPTASGSGTANSARQAAFKACGATGQHTKAG